MPASERPIAIDDYDAARSEVIGTLRQSPDYLSLVEYGSVSVPGLSDLDFIVGVVDTPTPLACRQISKSVLPATALRLMDYATLMVMPHSTLHRVKAWDDIDARVIDGRPVAFLDFNGLETNIARIIDWMPERICRLMEMLACKTLYERKAIGVLKSTAYSINAIGDLVGHGLWPSQILTDIEEIRQHWFRLPTSRSERLRELLMQTLIVSKTSWRAFLDWLQNQDIYGPVQQPAELRFPNNTIYRFVLPVGSNEEVCVTSAVGTTFNFPRPLWRHFCVYAMGQGILSSRLRASMTPTFQAPNSAAMLACLENRIQLCNEWGEFLKANNFKHGLFKFGWFF